MTTRPAVLKRHKPVTDLTRPPAGQVCERCGATRFNWQDYSRPSPWTSPYCPGGKP